MPLDADGIWTNDLVVPGGRDPWLGSTTPVRWSRVERTSAPATRYRFADGSGSVGIVASVSDSFCSTLRRGCASPPTASSATALFAVTETDVRALLRAGAGDDEIAAALEGVGGVEVGWSPDQPGQLHPAPPIDVADRRLEAVDGLHPSRSAGPGSNGGRVVEGADPIAGPWPGAGCVWSPRWPAALRGRRDRKGRCAGRGSGGRDTGSPSGPPSSSPLCHGLSVSSVAVDFEVGDDSVGDRGAGRDGRPHRRGDGGA